MGVNQTLEWGDLPGFDPLQLLAPSRACESEGLVSGGGTTTSSDPIKPATNNYSRARPSHMHNHGQPGPAASPWHNKP